MSIKTIKWVVGVNGIISFGSRNRLRAVLGVARGVSKRAHHVIPWEYRKHAIVQAAAKAKDAFNMNDVLNAKIVEYFRHSGSHRRYNDWIRIRLQRMIDLGVHNNPDLAFEQLKSLVESLKHIIDANPSVKINELPLP